MQLLVGSLKEFEEDSHEGIPGESPDRIPERNAWNNSGGIFKI